MIIKLVNSAANRGYLRGGFRKRFRRFAGTTGSLEGRLRNFFAVMDSFVPFAAPYARFTRGTVMTRVAPGWCTMMVHNVRARASAAFASPS